MKLGIIGLGGRARGILNELRAIDPEIRVTALLDRNPQAALERLPEEERAGVSLHESVDSLVTKGRPDALIIATRCDTHAPFAIEASRYDLPLFLEKPIAHSMEQAIALEDAFSRSRIPVIIGFPLRASSLCERARTLLDQGAVGRIEHILAFNYVGYGNVYFDSWYRDYKITQGLFLQKATHDFDYLSHLVGAPIIRVAAMTSLGRVYRDASTKGPRPDPDSSYHEGVGTPETGMNEDASSALLEFANGAKGVYTQVFYSKRDHRRGATFSGFRGTLEFDWYQNKVTTVHHRIPYTDVSTAGDVGSHFGGDRKLARNFIDIVRHNAPSIAPIQAGLESVYACLAAKESAETRRFVEVRQVGC